MHQNPSDNRLQLLKEGNPTIKRKSPKNSLHKADNATRKLSIIWETGREMNFYYSNLLDTDFNPDDDPTLLTLEFYNRKVKLKGYNLHRLSALFRLDEPRVIAVTPSRYTALADGDQFVVTEVIIEK